MARVEYIRNLEFETTPSIKVISRKTFRKKIGGGDTDISKDGRAFANIKYEALFLVNESANAIEIQRQNRKASVGGFYAPGRNTIVLITNSPAQPRIPSGILAHELMHALQDQHLPKVKFPGIEDTSNAHRGATEGDASYVEHLYKQRCKGQWLGTCLQPANRGERSDSGPELANVGLYIILSVGSLDSFQH